MYMNKCAWLQVNIFLKKSPEVRNIMSECKQHEIGILGGSLRSFHDFPQRLRGASQRAPSPSK